MTLVEQDPLIRSTLESTARRVAAALAAATCAADAPSRPGARHRPLIDAVKDRVALVGSAESLPSLLADVAEDLGAGATWAETYARAQAVALAELVVAAESQRKPAEVPALGDTFTDWAWTQRIDRPEPPLHAAANLVRDYVEHASAEGLSAPGARRIEKALQKLAQRAPAIEYGQPRAAVLQRRVTPPVHPEPLPELAVTAAPQQDCEADLDRPAVLADIADLISTERVRVARTPAAQELTARLAGCAQALAQIDQLVAVARAPVSAYGAQPGRVPKAFAELVRAIVRLSAAVHDFTADAAGAGWRTELGRAADLLDPVRANHDPVALDADGRFDVLTLARTAARLRLGARQQARLLRLVPLDKRSLDPDEAEARRLDALVHDPYPPVSTFDTGTGRTLVDARTSQGGLDAIVAHDGAHDVARSGLLGRRGLGRIGRAVVKHVPGLTPDQHAEATALVTEAEWHESVLVAAERSRPDAAPADIVPAGALALLGPGARDEIERRARASWIEGVVVPADPVHELLRLAALDNSQRWPPDVRLTFDAYRRGLDRVEQLRAAAVGQVAGYAAAGDPTAAPPTAWTELVTSIRALPELRGRLEHTARAHEITTRVGAAGDLLAGALSRRRVVADPATGTYDVLSLALFRALVESLASGSHAHRLHLGLEHPASAGLVLTAGWNGRLQAVDGLPLAQFGAELVGALADCQLHDVTTLLPEVFVHHQAADPRFQDLNRMQQSPPRRWSRGTSTGPCWCAPGTPRSRRSSRTGRRGHSGPTRWPRSSSGSRTWL
ncbi:MAG: hypothetical protein DLM58_14015 [Pseudonocardiales bacterium]|nr:MAG: hypothetical protein DLM58_14015 [Pseudonocardiales bacterium]